MNKTPLTFLAITAATLMARTASAEPTEGAGKGDRGQKMQQRLKAADKDGDGKISKSEAEASLPRLAKHFDQIDTNKDGFLTRDEMHAWHQKQAAARQGQK